MRVPAPEHFDDSLRGPAVSARVGRWLGISFGVAFVTGLISHWAQLPIPPIPMPTRPVWGYRVTQGLHLVSGTVAVPLLLVKLWSVYPRLFQRPPGMGRRLVLHLLERGSIGVLVAAGIFQLTTGVLNASGWYPWTFSFRSTHYAVAWVAIGALVLHIGVKLPVIRQGLGEPVEMPEPGDRVGRRTLLRATWLAGGVAVLATAGSTVPWLRRVSVLAMRSGDGPGGIPVNRSARAAGATAAALSVSYRLTVEYAGRSVEFTRQQLLALPQHTERLPIACVQGWSASADWSGVRIRDLLDQVEAPPGREVRVSSLQTRGAFAATTLPASFAEDPLTLLALGLNGEALPIDHGFPARLIAPNRPGVLQTKWVTRLEVR
jgi:hypothetical protein